MDRDKIKRNTRKTLRDKTPPPQKKERQRDL